MNDLFEREQEIFDRAKKRISEKGTTFVIENCTE